MTLYSIGGVLVESALPLVEVPERRDGTSDCVIRVANAPFDVGGQEPLFDWKTDDGRTWMAGARHARGYLVRFPELAEFSLSADGRRIDLFAADDAPADTIRHLFLDQVFPLARALAGELALHASAIQTSVGAVAFVGATGDGKSTLTASFARAGFRPLADDWSRGAVGRAVRLTRADGSVVTVTLADYY